MAAFSIVKSIHRDRVKEATGRRRAHRAEAARENEFDRFTGAPSSSTSWDFAFPFTHSGR